MRLWSRRTPLVGAAAPFSGQPTQALVGCGRRLALEAPPTGVAAGRQCRQATVGVERAAARFAAARYVGNLNVRNVAHMRGDRRVEVDAVVREVEQVAQ